MNYGECRDKSLQLINQYSITGQPIPAAYNNQADYFLRIPGLVNDAQLYIAETTLPILATVKLREASDAHAPWGVAYFLPEDFMQEQPGGLRFYWEGRHHNEMGRSVRYQRFGPNHVCVDIPRGTEVWLEYYRRPKLVPTKPEDTFPLDNTAAAQHAIPYFVASNLVLYDDAYMSAKLDEKWKEQVAALQPRPQAQNMVVPDVYGGFGYDMWGW